MRVDPPDIPFALEWDRGLEAPSLQVTDAGDGREIAFEPLAFEAETLKELRDGS